MSALYTVVSEKLRSAPLDVSSLRKTLESGSDDQRIKAMEHIVAFTIAGDNLNSLLMDVIRFVLPSKNRQLKKLLHSYWEVVPKHDEHGKLRQEMILVVNAIRNDLQHPNEYIRGGTLRFLTKFREAELLEPLVPTIRQGLDHRHAYVRKNAVFCVLAIAQCENTKQLIPDASELLSALLAEEMDNTCRRNAFVALTRLDRDSAYAYFHSMFGQIAEADELLQLAFVYFAATDAIATPELLHTYVNILQSWLTESQSHQGNMSSAVGYECATALAGLTADQTVLAEVAASYIDIAVRETDINVKLTAINRVSALAEDDTLSPLVMDVLLVLPTQDIVLRRAALKLTLKLVSNRTVEDVLRMLKKELQNSFGKSYDTADEYRLAIIDTIHEIALRFNHVAVNVATLLLEFLGELNTSAASEVVSFVKEVSELQSEKKHSVLIQLADSLHSIHSARVYLSALWVLGEYATTESEIKHVWDALKEEIGQVPFKSDAETEEDVAESKKENEQPHTSTKPKILADGTYATESPLEVAAAAAAAAQSETNHLRKCLLEGDFFLAGALAATLTKLAIRYSQAASDKGTANRLKAEAMLIMSSVLRIQPTKINDDAFDRIYGCINVLVQGTPEAQNKFLENPHDAFHKLETRKKAAKAISSANAAGQSAVPVEEQIQFRLFSALNTGGLQRRKQQLKNSSESENIVSNLSQSQLKQVTQLTGYSDPVYAEALMTVAQFDINLDVMIFNQTKDTLENLKVELFTTGELKIVESPSAVNVAPMSFHTCRVTVRVSSVDSATIFGDIAYDCKKKNSVVLLNDIRLNIMDYIRPETCSDESFRLMWVKFEWENKVPVLNTTAKTLSKYLDTFVKRTNMRCLTEGAVSDPDAKFLSANLYAKSCFGEAVLANLSVELKEDDSIVGHVRVRAKQKGAAVSVGDCALTI